MQKVLYRSQPIAYGWRGYQIRKGTFQEDGTQTWEDASDSDGRRYPPMRYDLAEEEVALLNEEESTNGNG